MRKFRSDGDNLRDTRIAYTFLLSLAAVCAILGVIATRLDTGLQSARIADAYESLTLCADALSEWQNAKCEDDRKAAALRFENAAVSLPREVNAEVLLDFAEHMYAGDADTAHAAAMLDTFTLLGAIEYADEAEARAVIAEAVNRVCERLFAVEVSLPEDSAVSAEILPEVLHFTKRVVKNGIKDLVGTGGGAIEAALSEDGGSYIAEASNLRMIFSAETGRLTEFVYIRLGAAPKDMLSEDERLSRAREFVCKARRSADIYDLEELRETCGLLTATLSAGEVSVSVSVDGYGRVWSYFEKQR